MQVPEPALRCGEVVEGGSGVPTDLGGLTGVAFPAPLPDVAAHMAPHKPVCHGSQGGPWSRVAEPVEGFKNVPGQHRWDDGANSPGGDITPEFMPLEAEEPRPKAGLWGPEEIHLRAAAALVCGGDEGQVDRGEVDRRHAPGEGISDDIFRALDVPDVACEFSHV